VLWVLASVPITGCSATNIPCSKGQTVWTCTIQGTPCHYPYINPYGFCAANEQDAIVQANTDALAHLKPKDQNIVGTTCTNTGKTSMPWHPPVGPQGVPLRPQNMPSCVADPSDNACVACAKAACCGAYQACYSDTNCSCLVGCLYQGNSAAACTSTDNCGPPSAVSLSTAVCLDTTCATECTSAGSMGSSMCPDMTGTGSGTGSSSGGPSCTPGPTPPAGSCFQDTDCQSCSCDMQTMSCN
jgi:hypothetical protein